MEVERVPKFDVRRDHAVQSAVPDLDGLKLENEVKAEMHDVRRDKPKSDQLAGVPGTMDIERLRYRSSAAGAAVGKPQEFLKLGSEVEAEVHDVRLDSTKVDQSAGMLGAMDIERLRCAAWQAARSHARPRSPVPAIASLDVDRAVKTAEKEAALAGVKAAGLSGTMEVKCLR